jgi:hypothetical protein
MASELKLSLHKACLKQLQDKIDILQSEFKVYKEAAANESKSTAGDKHDTSRSMMQLEQEKMGVQLKDLMNQKKVMLSVEQELDNKDSSLGKIIYTNQGNFFISIFAKPIEIDGQLFIPISMQAPVAKLLNSVKGKSFSFNGKAYNVVSID